MNQIPEIEKCWGEYDGSAPINMKHGFNLYLRPKCEYSKKRFIYRIAEANEIDFLKDYLDFSKMICFDVGANIGYWSKFLEHKKSKQLHSFEPDPSCYEILKKNITNDGYVLNRLAVSNKEGVCKIWVDPNHSGDNRPQEVEGREYINSEIVTIDGYLKKHNLSSIDFLKIDIQGGEYLALLGATQSIHEFLPIILIEIDRSLNPGMNLLLDEWVIKNLSLGGNGGKYKANTISNNSLKELSVSEYLEYQGNLLLIKE